MSGGHRLDAVTAMKVAAIVADFCESIPEQAASRAVPALCRCLIGEVMDRMDQDVDLNGFIQHMLGKIALLVERNRLGSDDLH